MDYNALGPADLAAVLNGNRNNGYNDGMGFGGGAWWWIIILFLFGMNGGWGRGGYGNGGGNGFADMYPWMNQQNQVNDGFRDQMISNKIDGIQNGITTGFGNVQTALCSGFAGVDAGIAAAQTGIAQQMYANQIADMQQAFALQSQLAQCCCDNRMATADLKYTVADQACQNRNANAINTRDIVDAVRAGNQGLMDKLCQLELDGVRAERDAERRANADLREQVTQLTLGNQLNQGFAQEVDNLYNRLNNCPVPSTPVYGKTPIFTCNGNNGYSGCGCGYAA